jgi:hypothetical protein
MTPAHAASPSAPPKGNNGNHYGQIDNPGNRYGLDKH